MESEKLKIYKNRLFVSDLIFDVLTDKITVLEALSRFPKDNNDINIKCAFDALTHREADEDMRQKISDYAIVQDDYLIDIANMLKENQRFPDEYIQNYIKYHNDTLISEEENFKSILKKIKRMINF